MAPIDSDESWEDHCNDESGCWVKDENDMLRWQSYYDYEDADDDNIDRDYDNEYSKEDIPVNSADIGKEYVMLKEKIKEWEQLINEIIRVLGKSEPILTNLEDLSNEMWKINNY